MAAPRCRCLLVLHSPRSRRGESVIGIFMSHHPLPLSLVTRSVLPALAGLALAACSPAPPTSAPMAAAGKASACTADVAWLTGSALPTEVAAPQAMCNFEQFMWQSMLALVQPASVDPPLVRCEPWMPSYGIFVKDGVPTPWGQEPANDCAAGAKAGSPRLYSDII